jgi:hypothetical protein
MQYTQESVQLFPQNIYPPNEYEFWILILEIFFLNINCISKNQNV